MNGGARGLRNGLTLRAPSRAFLIITSPIYLPIWAFYDLRVPETRAAQANLAREYGIHGFCYYHYWFNGRRLLHRPFDEVLATGQPDFPFCLCWANENWTRAWDGGQSQILLAQHYDAEDDRRHLQWLAPALADRRAIQVDGKPLFAVYRAGLLPEPRRTTDIWRQEATRLGLGELFLCRVESGFRSERSDPEKLGFDAAIEFQPDFLELERAVVNRFSSRPRLHRWLAVKKDGLRRRIEKLPFVQSDRGDRLFDYNTLPELMLTKTLPSYRRFSCVTPSWDNSARRERRAIIFRHSTPDVYEFWLRSVIKRARQSPSAEQLVFVNAWNEWAEGSHLEPDQQSGRAYLEATLRAQSL